MPAPRPPPPPMPPSPSPDSDRKGTLEGVQDVEPSPPPPPPVPPAPPHLSSSPPRLKLPPPQPPQPTQQPQPPGSKEGPSLIASAAAGVAASTAAGTSTTPAAGTQLTQTPVSTTTEPLKISPTKKISPSSALRTKGSKGSSGGSGEMSKYSVGFVDLKDKDKEKKDVYTQQKEEKKKDNLALLGELMSAHPSKGSPNSNANNAAKGSPRSSPKGSSPKTLLPPSNKSSPGKSPGTQPSQPKQPKQPTQSKQPAQQKGPTKSTPSPPKPSTVTRSKTAPAPPPASIKLSPKITPNPQPKSLSTTNSKSNANINTSNQPTPHRKLSQLSQLSQNSSGSARSFTGLSSYPLTLDRVISSQFESEAETHILAALEAEEYEQREREREAMGGMGGRDNSEYQSRLLGEGIRYDEDGEVALEGGMDGMDGLQGFDGLERMHGRWQSMQSGHGVQGMHVSRPSGVSGISRYSGVSGVSRAFGGGGEQGGASEVDANTNEQALDATDTTDGGMEDYSDDDDDDQAKTGVSGVSGDTNNSNTSATTGRPRSMSNDTFLKNVQMQNYNQQYFTTAISMSPDAESQQGQHGNDGQYQQYQQRQQQYQQQQLEQQTLSPKMQHRKQLSKAALAVQTEADNEDEDEDEVTVELKQKSTTMKFSRHSTDDISHTTDQAGNHNTSNNTKKTDTSKPTETPATPGTPSNMGSMARRLHQMQRGRTMKFAQSMRSSISSRSINSDTAPGALGAEPQSQGEKLIDALHRAEQNRQGTWWRKVLFEITQLILPKLPTFQRNISHVLFFVIIPGLFAACLLFYMLENPMVGETGTSWSWWILFLVVRQPMIFEFVRIGEIFWIEIMALRSSVFNMAVGPYVALAFIQSKGWPYIITFWAVMDFCFLYGDHKFPKHWLFYQKKLDVFNERNPVNGVTDNEFYMRLLLDMIFVGVVVSLKRMSLAIYLERRTVYHFGSELEKLMSKMILIGEVANLAKDIEGKQNMLTGFGPLSPLHDDVDDEKLVRFRDFVRRTSINSSGESPSPNKPVSRKKLDDDSSHKGTPPLGNRPSLVERGKTDGSSPSPPSVGHPKLERGKTDASSSPSVATHKHREYATSSAKNQKLLYLLSEWEEPETATVQKNKASIKELLQFRKAVSYMDDKYPFSHAFGPAKTRDLCVESAQKVYERLMMSTDATILPFSVFTVLALDESGELVEDKMKSLMRLFRPDRDGTLTKLDFVKSVDAVYKQLRLLRASIANSAQIDYAFEKIVNCFFYFFLVIIAVTIMGLNIWSVFLSFNTFFLGFSFLFGAAASNYFEGLLLIFVRRPYDIGDRIATSNPRNDTSPDGSSTWFVDRVTLFTTTVRFATTNEVATYSNGSLALLRIINANRSPKAIVTIPIKFGLETPFSKVKIFRTAVENFVKARPREWISILAFRASSVEADLGYVEYKIVLQHREKWQNIGPILESKANLSSFILEVTKKLVMKYESPPMPVNLSASSAFNLGELFNEDIAPKSAAYYDAVQGENGTGQGEQNMSAEDLQEVVALFATGEKKT